VDMGSGCGSRPPSQDHGCGVVSLVAFHHIQVPGGIDDRGEGVGAR
jgi:hypothetical protein